MSLIGFSFGNSKNRNQIIKDYTNKLKNKTNIADEAVKTFHKQFNQGKYREIYEQIHEPFKNNNSLLDILNSCAAIKNKLGSVNSTSQIFTCYQTNFSKSTAIETLVWLLKDDHPRLVSYQMLPIFDTQSSELSLSNSTP